MAEKSREDAKRHVIESINDDQMSAFAHEGFDVEAIIDELRELTGDYDFDEITTDQFMAVVAKHDDSAIGGPDGPIDERSQAEKSDPNWRA
jgi:hypothetical protein